MRIGVFVSETWGAPSTISEVRQRAIEAETLGFSSIWLPYLPWAVDAIAAAHAAAQVTSSIEIGTAVVPTYLFHPLAMARAAHTVFDASHGRFALGVGPSQPTVIEKMHGIPFQRPAHHTREYLEVLRAAAAGHPSVDHDGEIFRLASMYGVPTAAAKQSMPLFVGALGEQMLRVAGELADGTIATSCDEGAIERIIVPGVSAAAATAGRPAPRVGTVLAVCVAEGSALEAAREAMYAHFATYERIPRYARMLSLGNKERMGDVHICGDETTVRARLRAFAEAGLTDLVAAPFMHGPDPAAQRASRAPTLALLADAAQHRV